VIIEKNDKSGYLYFVEKDRKDAKNWIGCRIDFCGFTGDQAPFPVIANSEYLKKKLIYNI
jgi:hypothetical protein